MSLTKVFFLSSEIEPFSNTCSLSNFSFDFGLEIKNNKDVDIRMCQPKYGYISERKYILREVIRLKDLSIDFAEGEKIANLKSAFIPKSRVQVYFAEGEDMFESVTDLLYKSKNGRLFNENGIRFAFFCKSVLFSLKKLFWAPEVVVSNDWQTSFIPLLGKTVFSKDDFYSDIKYVHIVHSYNKNINLDQESFKSLNLLEQVGDNFDSFLNPVKYADFTVILNDVNAPIIDKINKDSASKNVLKGAKHKVYNIDYTSLNYKDEINNVIKDIRSL